jgi:hypothetical protein
MYFKRFPNSLRYFAARLRAWSRPTILVPMVIFTIGGLLLWEVAVNPEFISIDEEKEITESNLTNQEGAMSSEDSAIAAEIDTVPFLTNQLHNSSEAAGLLNSAVLPTKGLFDEIHNRQVEPTKTPPAPKPSSTNPYQTSPNSEIPTVSVSTNSNYANSLTDPILNGTTLGNSNYSAETTFPLSANSPNAENSRDPYLGVSPLQIAMEQESKKAREKESKVSGEISLCYLPSSLCPVSSSPDSAATNGANNSLKAKEDEALSTNQPQFSHPLVTSSASMPERNPSISTNTVLTSQPNQQLNNPYQTNLSRSELVPEVTPVVPITPSATITGVEATVPQNYEQASYPSSLQTTKIINSVVPNSQNFRFPTVSPAGSNPYSQVNQTLPANGQVTNSVPEPLPMTGRYIGEGKINTFANP